MRESGFNCGMSVLAFMDRLKFLETISRTFLVLYRDSVSSSNLMEDASALCELSWCSACIRFLDATRCCIQVNSIESIKGSNGEHNLREQENIISKFQKNFEDSFEHFILVFRVAVSETPALLWEAQSAIFFDQLTCETISYCCRAVPNYINDTLSFFNGGNNISRDVSKNSKDSSWHNDFFRKRAIEECAHKISANKEFHELNLKLENLIRAKRNSPENPSEQDTYSFVEKEFKVRSVKARKEG